MRKDKILFISKRYKNNNNKILIFKNLSFLSIILFIIIISFKSTAKNSNEESFNINFSKNIKKRSTSILKTLKEKMIQKSDLLNIIKIDALIYYHLTWSKKKKLFSLIMNKIYDIFIKISKFYRQ